MFYFKKLLNIPIKEKRSLREGVVGETVGFPTLYSRPPDSKKSLKQWIQPI